MTTVIVTAVLHTTKVSGLADKPPALQANPPLSLQGMVEAYNLLERIQALGPYHSLYCSRLARTADVMSVIALALNQDFQTRAGLGQHANKEGDVTFRYPGHEHESVLEWQRDTVETLQQLEKEHGPKAHILIVTHRPCVAGLRAKTRGIETQDGIMMMLDAPVMKEPIHRFDVTDGNITLIA